MRCIKPGEPLKSGGSPPAQIGGESDAPERFTLENIGLRGEDREALCRLLDGTAGGIILIAGPAGSGKSATLRAMREYLRREDVVTVDGIRDGQTAELAAGAAAEGRLVLSAVRAGSAASAAVRLLELGVDPGLLAGAVKGIVFQRLVRRLCLRCRRPYTPTLEEIDATGMPPGDYLFYRGAGCDACSGGGYRGHVGVFERLAVTPAIRRAICARSLPELERAAEAAVRYPAVDTFRRLVLGGVTSTGEIRRVLGCG